MLFQIKFSFYFQTSPNNKPCWSPENSIWKTCMHSKYWIAGFQLDNLTSKEIIYIRFKTCLSVQSIMLCINESVKVYSSLKSRPMGVCIYMLTLSTNSIPEHFSTNLGELGNYWSGNVCVCCQFYLFEKSHRQKFWANPKTKMSHEEPKTNKTCSWLIGNASSKLFS